MDLLSYKMRNSTEKNRKSWTLIPFVRVSVLVIDPTIPLHYLPWSKWFFSCSLWRPRLFSRKGKSKKRRVTLCPFQQESTGILDCLREDSKISHNTRWLINENLANTHSQQRFRKRHKVQENLRRNTINENIKNAQSQRGLSKPTK